MYIALVCDKITFEVNFVTEYIYKTIDERELSLYVMEPTVKKYDKSPICLFIPGGGWKMANGKGMLGFSKRIVDKVLSEGCTAVGVDYRIVTEENVGIFEVISDCFDAVRYLVHNANELGLDKHRIATIGHSAGGHLALMTAYADSSLFTVDSILNDTFKVNVSAVMSPATVLYNEGIAQTLGFPVNSLFRKNDTLEQRQLASPISHVSNQTPPTLLAAGTSDRLVFPNSSELLFAKLQESGVDSELILSLASGHVFEKMHEQFDVGITMAEIQEKCAKFILDRI